MPEQIKYQLIEQQMKEAYVDYAMSVIVGRALPDVKDGLKPVHRRILFAMHQMGMFHNKPFKKSARIVGETLGKFHPHGDTSVYDAMIRMAQDFSLRYLLIDGHGNMGSIDGDSPASMRYTEARLDKKAEEMLVDIEKETVDFQPNFDGSMQEPIVLPSKLPNLILNGSTGIAVGMATNIPPHNLKEISEAIIKLLDDPEFSIEELMQIVTGPDFPTGGIIHGRAGIKSAYATGNGKIKVRAKLEVEEKKGKERIIVTEIPYMVNKTTLIESIANSVRDKRIPDISDIRDESDRKGMRIVFELKRDANAQVVINQLYKLSQLQTTFGVNILALCDNQPKVLNLKQVLEHYINHRKDVITRRTRYELKKAEDRAHILEGLRIALGKIDDVVQTVKKSKSPAEAKEALMKKFELTEIQAQAILDMKLQKLTSLEQNKIKEEYAKLIELIKDLKDILASEQRVIDIIKAEVTEMSDKYGDERRTEIMDAEDDLEMEDLIPRENCIVTVTCSGYVKRMPLDAYKVQKRGGKGVKGTQMKEEDVISHVFTTSTHDYILVFSNKGKVYWLKGYQIPEGGRYAKGKAIVNLLRMAKDEKVNTMIPVKQFDDKHYLIMVTKNGLIKKSSIMDYSRPRKGGIIAINLKEKDELVQVRLTPGRLKFIIGSKNGKAVKFDEEQDVRVMGRTATGVRGIKLDKGDEVVGIEVALDIATLLTVTENGYGKRTSITEYNLVHRGGKGVINIQTTERNGKVVGIQTVMDHDEILVISEKGIVIRIPASDISKIGRNTQGVRIMNMKDSDKVTTVTRIINHEN